MFKRISWKIDMFFARIEVQCFELNKATHTEDYENAKETLEGLESRGVKAGWLRMPDSNSTEENKCDGCPYEHQEPCPLDSCPFE